MMQLAYPKVAQQKSGAFRPRVCFRWRIPDSPAKKLAGSKTHSKLMPSASSLGQREGFVSASNQTGLETRSNDPKVRLQWGLLEGKVGGEPRLESSLTMLVIDPLRERVPNNPSWTWTQPWAQALLSDYSSNWRASSSAIKR